MPFLPRSPLRFRPFLRPMVWGGRRLADCLGKQLPTAQAYGESWEISDHPLHLSIATSPCPGRTLRQLCRESPRELLGSRAATVFPWLIKFLDASDRLSVQVHPDENAVGKLWPGEGSKNEAWFVLQADPDSRIWAGLRPGVTEAVLRQHLAATTVAECLHSFTPRPGDCLFLPAGTVHAVGGGVLLAEVQQSSDATFRLYDWDRRDEQGRSRPLHIEQALACIDWQAGPITPRHVQGFGQAQDPVRQELVRCRYFHLDFLRQSEPFTLGGIGRLQAVMVLRGKGFCAGAEGEQRLRPGDTLLLPAALPATWVGPEGVLELLIATLPEEGEGGQG